MLSEKPWRPESVLRLVMWLFVSLTAGALLISLLNPSQGAPLTGELKFQAFLISLVVFHGVAVLLVFQLLRLHGIGWKAAFGFRLANAGQVVGLAVLVALAATPVTQLVAEWTVSLMQHFSVKAETQMAVQTLQTAETAGQRVMFGVFAIAVAPFVEEILFRGIIYPAIKQNGFPVLAWWVTSLLFAATHSNVMTFVPLTLLALALTWLYERTDNLLTPILAHSLFNAMSFFWIVFHPEPLALISPWGP